MSLWGEVIVLTVTNLDVVRVQFQSCGGIGNGVAKGLEFDLGLFKTESYHKLVKLNPCVSREDQYCNRDGGPTYLSPVTEERGLFIIFFDCLRIKVYRGRPVMLGKCLVTLRLKRGGSLLVRSHGAE